MLQVECISYASQELEEKEALMMQTPSLSLPPLYSTPAHLTTSAPVGTPAASCFKSAKAETCDKTPDGCAIVNSEEQHTRKLKSTVRKCHVNGKPCLCSCCCWGYEKYQCAISI